MKKSDILALMNKKQNAMNRFTCITEADLKKAQKAIKAMCYFGWKEEKAAEIITTDYVNGSAFWYPGYMVREMEKNRKTA